MTRTIETAVKEINFGRDYTFVCEDGTYTIPASEAIAQSRFNPIEIGKKILLVLVGDMIISYKNI